MSEGADGAVDSNARWRELVFPAGYRNPQPAPRYNLVVIGAGPAGLITAIAAAGLGAKVALIERHAMGGDCLNVGCVPSKTLLASAFAGLDFRAAMERVRAVRAAIAVVDSVQRYTQAGVDVFLGDAEFGGPHEVRVGDAILRTRKTVIATGARASLPPVPGLAEVEPLTNETVFDLTEQPRRLAILGAGPVGCELAQAFARLGTEVHLIEVEARALQADEPEAAAYVQRGLEATGVRAHFGNGVTGVRPLAGGVRLSLAGGGAAGNVVEADRVLVAAGRRRNVESLALERAGVRFDAKSGIEVDARLRTSHADIFAAGDVCSRLQFTHNADAQARIVIRNTLFLGRARADRLVVPWCTYTKPELAHVGATRAELAQAGTPFDPFRVPFGELDRGRTDDADDGYAEALVSPRDGRILGATIVGRDAGEQIAPVVILMQNRMTLASLASVVLPYPTRSEYLRRLADAWNRTRLTPTVARAIRWWLARAR
jgi:pyruvate/2-oxoglutarate dehydrogenase complex dihydrolipoamide dehydrogenase (E3) component